MKVVIAVFVLLSSVFSVSLAGGKVLCDLEWVSLSSSGGGDVPENAVIAGANQYVGRHKSTLSPGRFDVNDGVLYTVELDAGSKPVAMKYPSAQVELLVNTEDCEVSWLNYTTVISRGDSAKSNPVPADPLRGIGRVDAFETSVTGWYALNNNGLGATLYVNWNDQVYPSTDFEVLTSSSPLIFGTLAKMRFQADMSELERKMKVEVFAVEDVVHMAVGSSIKQTIEHTYSMNEEYLFMEPGWNHLGISALTLDMKTLTTNQRFFDLLDARDPDVTELKLIKGAKYEVKRELEIIQNSSVQLCSAASFVENFEVPFTATLEIDVEENGLSLNHVKEILKRSGRQYQSYNGVVVKATYSGLMRGTFFVKGGTYTEPYTPDGEGCFAKIAA